MLELLGGEFALASDLIEDADKSANVSVSAGGDVTQDAELFGHFTGGGARAEERTGSGGKIRHFKRSIRRQAFQISHDGGSLLSGLGDRADGPWPDLTVAHETGHFLDHAGAPGTRPFWQLQTEHDTTQDLAAWWKAANDSKALGRIQALKVRTQKELKSKKYYLQPCEVWARSYAQYIAEESGDAVMKMQVQTILGSGGRYADRHWEESDFAPIRQAMTDLFVKWGWSKPQTPQAP